MSVLDAEVARQMSRVRKRIGGRLETLYVKTRVRESSFDRLDKGKRIQ